MTPLRRKREPGAGGGPKLAGSRLHTRVRIVILGLIALLVAVNGVVALNRWLASRDGSGASAQAAVAPLAVGTALDRPVPNLPLVDESGHATSLAAFRGHYVVMAPSLTLCHEVCPMTTGALEAVGQSVADNRLGGQVDIVTISVDPWRDSPARIRAYKRLTGARFRMLTGTPAEIGRVWRFFGVEYHRTPQGSPPDVDWLTGRPESFDVSHTDGLFLLDPRGHLRILTVGMPDVGGNLPVRLKAMLNDQGRANLAHPQAPWSVEAALDDLFHLMGRPTPGTDLPAPPPAPTLAAARAALAGSPAPLAALHAQAGRLLDGGAQAFRSRLAALKGHPVVVNEWASWCFPCRHEFPLFASAAAAYGKRIAFLGLNVNDTSTASARAFLARQRITYPSYTDPDGSIAGSLAPLEGVPTTVFIDSSGKVTDSHAGVYGTGTSLAADIQQYALARGG